MVSYEGTTVSRKISESPNIIHTLALIASSFRYESARKLEEQTHLWRDEIARTLLDGDLAPEGIRHLAPIPLEAFPVIVVPVEEVHLAGGLLDLRVKEQHLEERPGPAFAHPDDDRLR